MRLPLLCAWAWALASASASAGGGAPAPAASQERVLLLSALGLKAQPKPRRAPAPEVPPRLWQLYRARSLKGRTAGAACWIEEFRVRGNIIRLFPDQGQFIHRREHQSWLCLQKRLYFNFSALDEGETLTLAQLEIKLHHNASHPSRPFELTLYKASQLALRGMSAHAYTRHPLAEQSFIHLHKAFVFNLTEVAKDWHVPGKNFGLILEIALAAGDGFSTLLDERLCSSLDSFLDASLLVISLAPNQCKTTRKKRSSYYMPVSPSNICKPRRLYISFGDIGWENWIIAPQGYMANYCLGDCPFPLTEDLNSTNHAILQTMVHSLDPEGTPQPCCVPVRLSPISILYYDNDDNVVLRHYEDMVVDECGCR